MKSKVALTKGGSRTENIYQSLQLLGDDIDLTGKKDVFIKVNFTTPRNNGLGATHVDAVRSLLKFLRERYTGKITIGESTSMPAQKRYEQFDYPGLVEEFGVELVDLNTGNWSMVEVYDASFRPMKLRFSQQVINSDYRIAIGPAKTHDVVGVTLSIKNLAMGALDDADGNKRKMHQGYPVHNLNLYLLAKAYPLQLAVNHGYIGMEGEGPVAGTAINWGTAIASCDPIAADSLTAQLMGFDINDVGYLWYLQHQGLGVSDINRMDIVGANPKDCYHKFKPHSMFESQRHWRDESVNKLLGIKGAGLELDRPFFLS